MSKSLMAGKHGEELHRLFAKYEIPVEGVYDSECCTSPCCYHGGGKQEKFIAALQKYDKKHGTEFSKYCYVGDIDSVDDMLRYEAIRTCQHEWKSQGFPSMTTSGIREHFICGKCGDGKYGPSQGGSPWGSASPW